MKTLMTLLMTCVALVMMSASAMAGGDNGGAKDDGTIVVKNDYPGYVMAVAVGAPAGATVTDFLALGAKFVQPGDAAEFSVAAGNQTVSAIFIDDLLIAAPVTDQIDVGVVKKQVTNVQGVAPGILVN